MADKDHELEVQNQNEGKESSDSMLDVLDESVDGLFDGADDISISDIPSESDGKLDLFAADEHFSLDNLLEGEDPFESMELASMDLDVIGVQNLMADDDDLQPVEPYPEVDDAVDAKVQKVAENQHVTPNRVLEAVNEADKHFDNAFANDERTMEVSVTDLEKYAMLADEEEEATKVAESVNLGDIAIAEAVRNALKSGTDQSSEEAKADDEAKAVKADDEAEKASDDAKKADAAEKSDDAKKVDAVEQSDEKKSDDGVTAEKVNDVMEKEGFEANSNVTLTVNFSDVVKAAEESEEKADNAEAEEDAPVKINIAKGKKGDRVNLTERAKMGNVMPENEVKEAEHEIHKDTIYDEEVCEAVADPVVRDREIKGYLIYAILGLALLGLIGLIFLLVTEFSISRSSTVTIAQNYAIKVTNVKWDQYATSNDGHWAAACNNQRGAVWHDDKLVATFMPNNGCLGLQIEADGSAVTYVANQSRLMKVDLVKSMGFSDSVIGAYEGLENSVYTAKSNAAPSYVRVKPDLSGLTLVKKAGKQEENIDLPMDALVCFGSRGDALAYITGMNMVVSREGQPDLVVSLDEAKLACPRQFAAGCAYDGKDGWVALCQNNYVTGRGSKITSRDQYDFMRLKVGADMFSIQRHENGTEIVTPNKWIHIPESGKLSEVKLSKQLEGELSFAYRKFDDGSLFGIADGSITKITKNGAVFMEPGKDSELVFAGFVAEGRQAVQIWNSKGANAQDSTLSLWDVANAKLMNILALKGNVTGVNVSPKGHVGFVMIGNAINWMNWDSASKIGELVVAENVIDATWSSDEKHVIISYESGKSEVYGVDASGAKLVSSFDKDIDVAFHSDEFIWTFNYNNDDKTPRLRMMRLDDGRYGVYFSTVENALKNHVVNRVTTNSNSKYLVFWGTEGIWSYDVQQNRMIQVTNNPASWLSLSNDGKFVATESGVYDISAKDNRRILYPENSMPLVWTGDDAYVMSSDGSDIFGVANQEYLAANSRVSRDVNLIGRSSGLHPYYLELLEIRDNLASIVTFAQQSKNIAAAFTGVDNNTWCWIASNGQVQGAQDVCSSLKGKAAAKPVVATNSEVTKLASKLVGTSDSKNQPEKPADFVDRVKLKVAAIPADTSAFFAAFGGELPTELNSPTLPVETTLTASDMGFAVSLFRDGYVTRTITLKANYPEINLNVMLLNADYADIKVKKRVTDGATDTEVSEDAAIALASFVGEHRADIKKCLDSNENLIVDVNEKCVINLTDVSEKNECLVNVFSSIEQKASCSEVVGLAENAFESFEITP